MKSIRNEGVFVRVYEFNVVILEDESGGEATLPSCQSSQVLIVRVIAWTR